MVRTQVYLPEADHRALRQTAEHEGISMTELVRRIVGAYVAGRRGAASFSKEAVMSFVALGRSGRADGSEQHDQALDEALRAGDLR
jgi:hypothetical protein